MTEFLSQSNLHRVADTVQRPAYDRNQLGVGIVHFGPGAFHRAHQAWYVESLLAQDPRWGICGVSLHSSDVRAALAPQDCLYTLATLDEETSYQVVGALREVLVAPDDPESVLKRLTAPATRIVTITVTEKGYCLSSDGSLDVTHPDIVADMCDPHAPSSLIGYLVEALRRRLEGGLDPLTIISCDNLVDNGARLAGAVLQFAGSRDSRLAEWIRDKVPFPRTMVDSITPATTAALRQTVADATGVSDRWPVQRESFIQWVMEDCSGSKVQAPDWEAAGVIVTDDVAAYDRAKLRLLNGAHSTLAYLGLLAGYETVSAAMGNKSLSTFVATLMKADIRPTIQAPRGLDLDAYIAAILKRFRNPALSHALAQIAWDGTQKLPFRILGTIADALAASGPIDRLCVPVAAWMQFVRRKAALGERVVDPLATQLLQIGAACQNRAATDVPAFLALASVFPHALAADERFRAALGRAYDMLSAQSKR